MEGIGTKIDEGVVVGRVNLTDKIPVGNGGNNASVATLAQILSLFADSDVLAEIRALIAHIEEYKASKIDLEKVTADFSNIATSLTLRMQGRGEYNPHLDFVKWVEFSSSTHGSSADAANAMQLYLDSLHGTAVLDEDIPIGFVNICHEGSHLLVWNNVNAWEHDQWTQIVFGGTLGESYGVQGMFPSVEGNIYKRHCSNGDWSEWEKVGDKMPDVSGFADKMYVDAELDKKSDKNTTNMALAGKADITDLADLLPCTKVKGILSALSFQPADGVYLQHSPASGGGMIMNNGPIDKLATIVLGKSTETPLEVGKIYYNTADKLCYVFDGHDCKPLGTPCDNGLDVTSLFEEGATMAISVLDLCKKNLYAMDRSVASQVQVINSERGAMLIMDSLKYSADEYGSYRGAMSRLCALLYEDNGSVTCTECFDVSMESEQQ